MVRAAHPLVTERLRSAVVRVSKVRPVHIVVESGKGITCPHENSAAIVHVLRHVIVQPRAEIGRAHMIVQIGGLVAVVAHADARFKNREIASAQIQARRRLVLAVGRTGRHQRAAQVGRHAYPGPQWHTLFGGQGCGSLLGRSVLHAAHPFTAHRIGLLGSHLCLYRANAAQ